MATFPDWCNASFRGSDLESELQKETKLLHTKSFGDSVAMGNQEGCSGVNFDFSLDASGNVGSQPLDTPHIKVDVHEQATVAQARALAAAILEAAHFWEEMGH